MAHASTHFTLAVLEGQKVISLPWWERLGIAVRAKLETAPAPTAADRAYAYAYRSLPVPTEER